MQMCCQWRSCKLQITYIHYSAVLWRCWLGGRKGIRPVKNWVVGCWHGYLSGARYRLAYGPADATVSCFSKIQTGFTFLVLAHPGSPGQRVVKCVCVCVYIHYRVAEKVARVQITVFSGTPQTFFRSFLFIFELMHRKGDLKLCNFLVHHV